MEELVSMIITIALMGSIVLLALLIERHYAKLHKKHLKLCEMCAEHDALVEKRYKEWRERYFDPKAEIDRTLEMMPYFTKVKQKEEEERLEGLRQIIEDYLSKDNSIDEQIEKLQKQIEEYARKNKLKIFLKRG